MKNLNNLKNAIKSTVNNMKTIPTFYNGYGYDRYLNRNWEWMAVNRVLKDLTRYNSHLIYKEKEKMFLVSDQLVAALKTEIAKHGLKETTHVGCFDLLSNAIFKRACIDGSSSTEEIKKVFNI